MHATIFSRFYWAGIEFSSFPLVGRNFLASMASTWALILFYNPAPSYGSLLLAGQAEGAFTVKMLLTVNAIFRVFCSIWIYQPPTSSRGLYAETILLTDPDPKSQILLLLTLGKPGQFVQLNEAYIYRTSWSLYYHWLMSPCPCTIIVRGGRGYAGSIWRRFPLHYQHQRHLWAEDPKTSFQALSLAY